MAPLNVRNLISKFEKLTTEIKGFEDREALKTPTTPKLNIRSFFPEENQQPIPSSTINGKISPIEKKIQDVREQIACIDEVSNDDFVKILFVLLNLLIELGTIEVDGDYSVKCRKDQCFKKIIVCKEELVKCLDDQFALDSGIIPAKSGVNDEDITENGDNELNEIITAPIARTVSVDEFVGFQSVSQMKNVFEKKGITFEAVPQAKIRSKSCTSLSPINTPPEVIVTNEDLPEELTPPEKSPESLDQNGINSFPSNKSLYESNAVLEFKSVKDMKNMFEGPNEKKATNVSNTTLNRLALELDDEEYEVPTPELPVAEDKPSSPPPNIPDNSHNVQKQIDIMDTLWAEMEYYESLVGNLDPSDVVRAEVLEENLVELFLEINKFNTLKDIELEDRKVKALTLADSIQSKINEKRTNLGLYINNLEDQHEEEIIENSDAGVLQSLVDEVEKYKDLVKAFDPSDTVRGQVLEENLCEVLLDLDKLEVEGIENGNRKTSAIKDLGMLLNLLNEKRETYEEVNVQKHPVKEPCVITDDNLNKDNNADETQDVKHNEHAQTNESSKLVEPVNPEQEIPNKTTSISESQVTEAFNDMYGLSEEEELKNARIFDSNGQLSDICVEINIINDIAESSVLDEEETEIFLRNIEEIREKLENLDTCEDEELTQSQRGALSFIVEIQKKIVNKARKTGN